MISGAWNRDLTGMGRTRVKICGITRPEDGQLAAILGADAIGLVFYPVSARGISAKQAQQIVSVLPPFVTVVALFVDPERSAVSEILQAVRVDALQFHGCEDPEFCAAFGLPYIKAVPMREGVDVIAAAARYSNASALLLDTFQSGKAGGTGQMFDWSLMPSGLDKPIILAGGLTAENVGEAIARLRPFAVDVSGGVEFSKGKKDPGKMTAFFRSVNSANAAGRTS